MFVSWRSCWLCRAGHSSKRSLQFRQWSGDSPLHHFPVFFHSSSIIPAWWKLPWNGDYSEAAGILTAAVLCCGCSVPELKWLRFLGKVVLLCAAGKHWPQMCFLHRVLFSLWIMACGRISFLHEFYRKEIFLIFWDNKMQTKTEFYWLA